MPRFHTFIFLPVVGFCFLLAGCSAGVKQDKPARPAIAKTYGNRMRDSLPESWSIGWHDNVLWIRRVGLITVANSVPNAPAANEPTTEPAATGPAPVTRMPLSSWTRQMAFVFAVTFTDPIKPAEYQRRVGINAKRETALENFRVQMNGIPHKFDEYLPRSPEEKKWVEKYRKAQKTLPHYDLPTLFAKDSSAKITDSVATDMGGFSYIVDPAVGTDCQETRQIIEGFFSKNPVEPDVAKKK